MVNWVVRLWALVLLVMMVGPMLLVVLLSFGNNPMIAFPLGGLTLRWYSALFEWPTFQQALRNSLIIAAVVGIVSPIVGTCASLGLARLEARISNVINIALCFPIILPGLV